MNSFTDYNLQPFLLKALDELNFIKPTEIQTELIPLIQQGKSVVGQSQTGSGKTHTFLIPLVNKIKENQAEVQLVITAPSRELASQIYQATLQLVQYSDTEIRVANFVGGTDKKRQIEKLRQLQPHIVIGTPGRILDMLKEQALKIHTASAFVVDEADMTLDMGFLAEVDQIAGRLPKKLQMLVFSATVPEKLKPFLKKYMENPEVVHIQPEHVLSVNIENWLIATKGKSANQVIYQLLTMGQSYLTLVFANTKQRVDELADFLKQQGLKVGKIHGDIPPRERKRAMRQIQNLEFQYVVATDLAARGIDITGISQVINAEIPNDPEFFVHRVGRTGRQKLSGVAITLYTPEDEEKLEEIEKLGVVFQPKEIKNNEIVDSYDRHRRKKRTRVQEELDITMKGLVKKKKQKIKPGYKKKLTRAIDENRKKKRMVEQRTKNREVRKARKQDY